MLRRSQIPARFLAPARVEPLDARLLMNGAAPLVSVDSSPLTYVEMQGPLKVDSGLTIGGDAGTMLDGAAVRLIGYVPGEDLLGVAAVPNGLAAAWDPAGGMLSLSGAMPAAVYQAALRSVTFADWSANPHTSPRLVEFSVEDAGFTGTAASRGVSVVATNNPPNVLTPPAEAVFAGATLTFGAAKGNAIEIGDVDADGSVEQLTLTAGEGSLTLPTVAGLSFTSGTGLAESEMTFTGTLNRINAALDGLTFTPAAGFSGSAAILVSADDLGNTGTGGAQIVNARVPIDVVAALVSTPTVSVAPIPAADPPPSSSSPLPGVGESPPPIGPPPPDSTHVETVRRSLPFVLSAAAASFVVDASPMSSTPPTLDASEAVSPARSGGAVAADAGSGTTVPAFSVQIRPRVFYAPPAGVPRSLSAREWSRSPSWARDFSIEPGGLQSSLEGAVAGAGGETGVGPSGRVREQMPFCTSASERAMSFPGSATPDHDVDVKAVARNGAWSAELDRLRRHVTSDVGLRVWAGTASVVSIGGSLAYFVWMGRTGSLWGTVFTSTPVWRAVDPLAVLDHLGRTGGLLKRNADEGWKTLLKDIEAG